MSSHLYAKLNEQDSEYRSRLITISTHGKSVTMPRRTLSLRGTYSESRAVLNPLVRGINEVYYLLDEETLNGIDNDKEKMLEFCKRLQAGFLKINCEKEISFFVFSYESQGKKPTPNQIAYLANLVTGSIYNDIIIPPIIHGISGKDYVEYLEGFMESLDSYVRNPRIMGSIPHVAHIDLIDICNFYAKNNVTFFALDCDGKNPIDMYPNVNEVYGTIRNIEKELGGEECCCLHGINVRRPRGLLKKGFAPAKDILVYAMGFNSFCSSHLKPRLTPDLWEKMPPPEFAWVFNRNDYGYYPTNTRDVESFPKETDAAVTIDDILSSSISKIKEKAKLFNTEQQGLEARYIQKRLMEQTLPKYLEGKKRANDILKQVKKRMPIVCL